MSSSPTKPGGAAGQDDALIERLRDRDVLCPSCGANLRGLTAGKCAGCGMELTVAMLQAARGPSVSPAMLAVRVLSAVAFCVALYLAWTGMTNRQPAGCAPGAGCGEVLSSEWSSLWGVPVSVPGVLVYFGVFLCTFYVSPRLKDQHRRDAWTVLLALAAFAGLAAVWFIYLQAFVIEAICPYCMIDHICGLIIAAFVYLNVPVSQGEKLANGGRSTMVLGQGRAIGLSVLAMMVMGMFILAQSAFRASTHVMITEGGNGGLDIEPPSTKDKGAAPVNGNKDAPPKAPVINETVGPLLPTTEPSVWVRLPRVPPPSQGLVRFQRAAVPMRGNINAKAVLVCMVDYTCPHCRALHQLMPQASQRYGDQLAFMVLPMPLNPDCNPYVNYREVRHAEACDLARMALAVWKTDAAKFAQFDDWLFEPEKSRDGAEARVMAEKLVGKEALKKTFDTGWPHEQALMHVRVYDMAGQGRIPKLMYNNVRIEGTINERDLWDWLESKDGPGLVPIQK